MHNAHIYPKGSCIWIQQLSKHSSNILVLRLIYVVVLQRKIGGGGFIQEGEGGKKLAKLVIQFMDAL